MAVHMGAKNLFIKVQFDKNNVRPTKAYMNGGILIKP